MLSRARLPPSPTAPARAAPSFLPQQAGVTRDSGPRHGSARSELHPFRWVPAGVCCSRLGRQGGIPGTDGAVPTQATPMRRPREPGLGGEARLNVPQGPPQVRADESGAPPAHSNLTSAFQRPSCSHYIGGSATNHRDRPINRPGLAHAAR